MIISTKSRESEAGFTLIEVIVAIVLGAIMGVIFLTYMGTQLTQSSDPVNIIRHEGEAERWMERIMSDYVEEMNAATCTTALATIKDRDYTAEPYKMPADVELTRTYVTYDVGGNEVEVTGGGTSSNLKVTVKATGGYGGYLLTSIFTAQRISCSGQYRDPVTYY